MWSQSGVFISEKDFGIFISETDFGNMSLDLPNWDFYYIVFVLRKESLHFTLLHRVYTSINRPWSVSKQPLASDRLP